MEYYIIIKIDHQGQNNNNNNNKNNSPPTKQQCYLLRTSRVRISVTYSFVLNKDALAVMENTELYAQSWESLAAKVGGGVGGVGVSSKGLEADKRGQTSQ